jgi:hypothetical protein
MFNGEPRNWDLLAVREKADIRSAFPQDGEDTLSDYIWTYDMDEATWDMDVA